MADFIAELTEDDKPRPSQEWSVFVDGSSNPKGCGAGIILENNEGITIEHSLRLEFPSSNNQAEYEACIVGLFLAKELGATRVKVMTESQLVTSQINGQYQAKEPLLQKYLAKVLEEITHFEQVIVEHVPRAMNVRADALPKLAITRKIGNYRSIIQTTLQKPSVIENIMAIEEQPEPSETDWRQPIMDYLNNRLQSETA